jgi:hypothetical protein
MGKPGLCSFVEVNYLSSSMEACPVLSALPLHAGNIVSAVRSPAQGDDIEDDYSHKNYE